MVLGKPSWIGHDLEIDLTRDILGASSTGYVIRITCFDQEYALKRTRTMDNKPPDLARLKHPHVVHLQHYWTEERGEGELWPRFDAGVNEESGPSEEKYMFLVMELMDGDIGQLMAEAKQAGVSPFSLPVARDIMLQIAKGMCYLHQMGVSHPHLKCANVLYTIVRETGEAFVVDDVIVRLGGFGCSRPADSASKKSDLRCFISTCVEILTEKESPDLILDESSIPETTPDILKDCIASMQLPFSEIVAKLEGLDNTKLTGKVECTSTSESIHPKIVHTKAEGSSVELRPIPSDLKEIFTVHQLHPQLGDVSTSVRATLIFFHGFHKAPEEWRRTWMTRDSKLVWPQTWLPEDLGAENIRVLSVSFEANLSGNYDRFETGKKLIWSLVLSPGGPKLGEIEGKIFLIGHSFGGVIIKSLVTEARKFVSEEIRNNINLEGALKCQRFLTSLETIVFYSVPHALMGQEFENYISECKNIFGSPRSSFLQSLWEDPQLIPGMNELSEEFERVVSDQQVKVLAFLEGQPMSKNRVLFTKKSCESRSWEWHKIDKDNHFEVCRPDSKNHSGYKEMKDHLQRHMEVSEAGKMVLQPRELTRTGELLTKRKGQMEVLELERDSSSQESQAPGMATSCGLQDASTTFGGDHEIVVEEVIDVADHASVDNDLTLMLQSLNAEDDSKKRHHLLQPKHKIFLSHSGAQKSFVADLCVDLERRGRHPFFDKSRSSLPVGEKFPSLIFDAIGQCEVGVVVLSEEFFTRSKWPMLELVAMVEESKKPNREIKIIPVFYGISRNKCRDPTFQSRWIECWKKWKRDDKRRIDLRKWTSVLGIFGSITGFERKDGMLDGELRAEINEAICQDVLPKTRWDDPKVEGKTRLCQEIRTKVYKGSQPKDLKSGVQMLGLYGMGGIGKTTICKMLCNELSGDFQVCHVEFGSQSQLALQRKALRMLSNIDFEELDEISDIGVCHGYLKTHIIQEKVFLVLDNVSKEQAKSFLEVKFGDGSVVLMTARSKEQLQDLGVKKGDCFAMPELKLEEAKSLFLSYACMEKDEVDQVLIEKCVKRCYFHKGQSSTSSGDEMHYHPLALKVLGSEIGDLIRQHDVARQAAVLARINTFNLSRKKEHPVFSILRSSFDLLLEEDQLLFLDAALFLPDHVEYRLLSCCGALEWLGMVHGEECDGIEQRLEGLKRRSLLESFGEYADDFRMHELWREFAAAEIEHEKWKNQHILFKSAGCNGKVDLTGFPKMSVVKLMEVEGDVALDVRGLKELKSLEVSLGGWRLLEVKGLGTLESLTYLRWEGVASSVCIAELVWLTNLKVVELVDFKGDKLPDMSKLTNLRILNLGYSRLLQRIELRNLTNLALLNIENCTSLQGVDISGCRLMKVLMNRYSNSFEELNVSSCPLLPSLDRLWALSKLRKLDITGCSAIKDLYDLTDLVMLEELRARQCDRLISLPRCKLPKLRVLDIESSKVPKGFEWKFGVKPITRFKNWIANYRVRINSELTHWRTRKGL